MAGLTNPESHAQLPDRLDWNSHAAHPEELTAEYRFRFGDLVEFSARARCTPAGLIAAGVGAGIAGALLVLAVGRLRR